MSRVPAARDPDPAAERPAAPSERSLTDAWSLGGVPIANRVVLAPLAGIGNWFVRLQAKRHGAGLVTSEMVSSFAIHHRNERTCTELLRIHPEEHPVSMQLFGHDPDVMESAAERVAAAGADLIDLNMGCPVPKVCKTGAGAALLDDPDKAVAIARAAARGSGLPVTVKLRSGLRPGDRSGLELAERLVHDGGVAGICLHPRHASQRHSGKPDHEAARELVELLPVPVIISGGISCPEKALEAFERTGATAVALARGSLGNPWLFEQLLGPRDVEPTRDEILTELDWVMDRRCSTSARSARAATCASSIPGTSSGCRATVRCRMRSSGRVAASGAHDPWPSSSFRRVMIRALLAACLLCCLGRRALTRRRSRVRIGSSPGLPRAAAVTGPLPDLQQRAPDDRSGSPRSRRPRALRRGGLDPGSPLFRHYLSVSQFARRFGAAPARVAAVRRTLAADGLDVGTAPANHLTIPVSGSASAVARAFDTSFDRVQLASGRIAFANRTAPTLPAGIAGDVQAVVGLDDLYVPQPAATTTKLRTAARPPGGAPTW